MPKIIGDSLADHRTLTRRKLFDALGELLADNPFDTITMAQIASRAGIGRTAVYNHFEDKEVLLLAYMKEATSEFGTTLRAAVETQSDPIERLRTYIRLHLEMTSHYHYQISGRLTLREQVSHPNSGHIHDHAGTVARYLGSLLIDAMNAGAIPKQDPRLLVPIIHACLMGAEAPEHNTESRTRAEVAEEFILRALGVEELRITPRRAP